MMHITESVCSDTSFGVQQKVYVKYYDTSPGIQQRLYVIDTSCGIKQNACKSYITLAYG